MPGPGFYWIGEEEEKELVDLIRSRYLFRYGDEKDPDFKHLVKDLERNVGRALGVKYTLAVSSGTAALITALAAAGIGPGDEVIVPGYTFIASMSSVIISNAVPVLAEIDESLTLDTQDVERKITPYTKAILPVHMLGNSCNLEALRKIADKHKLLLIEDAAQAFGGSYRGKPLGTVGQMGTYSFNFHKTINAGDGGMVVTDDKDLYTRAFAFHDQGHFPLRTGVEVGNRSVIGQNFRMTELNAAVLLAQFRKLDKIIERLRSLKRRFKNQIQDIKGLEFRKLNDPAGDCATLLTVLLPDGKSAEIVAKKLGTTTVIHSGWHVYNNMENILNMNTINPKNNPIQNQHYKGKAEYRKGMLPRTDRILERAINISVGVVDPGLGAAFGINLNSTDDEVDRQVAAFRKTVEEVL
ncbi:MAG TPA: DegT/DnrJ/EryC1/StrS family aminotransferase [Spirochaetia bacterium]|nr:DegT/DnrJ/EryC1/StrS family aminotransferase [Spirochaetia bacterium]